MNDCMNGLPSDADHLRFAVSIVEEELSMHLDAFIPAFLIFAVFGLVMPVLLSGIADAARGNTDAA